VRKFDSPYVADWYVISLRWLAVLGLIMSLAMAGQLTSLAGILLTALALWNTALTVLAGVNRRLNRHREISVFMDLVGAMSLFWLQGGFFGPASWAFVIPIFSAALYFEWRGMFIAVFVLAAYQALLAYLLEITFTAWIILAGFVGAMLLLGALFAFLSRALISQLRLSRTTQIEAQEKHQQLENKRLRAIYNLTATINATLNYQRVLESALDLSTRALSDDPNVETDNPLVSAVMLFSGEELKIGAYRRLSASDMRTSFPARQGILAQAVNDGLPVQSNNPKDDPELKSIIGFSQCQSFYCFPMRSGFNMYGVLLFGHPQPGYFTSDRCEVIEIVGHQAVVAIQNARLYDDLLSEKKRMVEAQEEARKKLARDLHDGPTQSVSGIAMRLSLVRRLLERDVRAAADEVQKVEDLAIRTAKEMRHMLFTLRPLVLESEGLIAALQAMAEKMKETYSQEVIIKVDEKAISQMDMGKLGVVFYIAEEAVNNARKHAKAPHIMVRIRPLEQDAEIMQLEIIDDGVGFNVEAVNASYDKRGSLGMVNLRERTELVNGLLRIDSAPGKGTRVQVFIPLNEAASDRLRHAR
jgi:signal transduction histidine kinase